MAEIQFLIFVNVREFRSLFVYFRPLLIPITITVSKWTTYWKRVDCVLGIRTRGCKLVGADEITELWWPPQICTFFSKLGQPRSLLSFLFSRFKQTSLQMLQQINMKKCPSSIQGWDSNPWPSEHESPPITTRPGLPPNYVHFLL